MVQVIDDFLNAIAGLLGPLSPFTKAIVPAALAVAVAVVKSVADGKIDTVSITIAVSGLALAVVAYLLPNKPKHA